MVSTSFMVDTSSHPRAQLHRCVERSAYESSVLAMFDEKAHLRPRSAVRTLVRDHHARRRAGGFQELLHEPLGNRKYNQTA
ncbi:hypothetical protein ACVIJW_004830 [Bradyrhizobium barranii subsp. barranii]